MQTRAIPASVAGRTLHFAVRIDDVREASADEQAAGRVATSAG